MERAFGGLKDGRAGIRNEVFFVRDPENVRVEFVGAVAVEFLKFRIEAVAVSGEMDVEVGRSPDHGDCFIMRMLFEVQKPKSIIVPAPTTGLVKPYPGITA